MVSLDLGVLDGDGVPIEDKHGFSVQGFTGSRLQDLTFDVDWDPSEVEPPAECEEGVGQPGITEETRVEWLFPVGHAEVALTSERPFDHPTTPNWVKRVKTCEQDTLALEIWGLEDVRFQRSPMEDSCEGLTELWINTTRARNTDLKTETIDCEDGNQEGKRVEIHPLPTTFWIKHPVPKLEAQQKVPFIDATVGVTIPGALFQSSEMIRSFEYVDTVRGCVMLNETWVEPESSAEQLVGWFDDVPRGAGCKLGVTPAAQSAGSSALSAGRLVMDGFSSVGHVIAEAAHRGQRGVECRLSGLASDLRIDWDVDGWTGQRDRARFQEAHATVDWLTCGARDQDDEHGGLLDLPSFPGGKINVDLQSQWRPSSGQSPVDTLIPGSLDIPDSSLTAARCLEWNYTADPKECEDWESTREIHDRIAQNHLRGAGRVFEDRTEIAVPWQKWSEALT